MQAEESKDKWTRMPDDELTKRSIDFANNYLKDHFRSGSMVERNLVLNTMCHGFYMGARYCESRATPTLWTRILRRPPANKTKMTDLYEWSKEASNAYIKSKKYARLSWTDQALIRATISHSFMQGYQSRCFSKWFQ